MKKINDTKEPWQMTKAEWFDYKFNKLPQKIQKQILSSEKGFVSIDDIRRQTDDEYEKERVVTLKEAALTFYENKKEATKDEVEIAIINILENYWNNL